MDFDTRPHNISLQPRTFFLEYANFVLLLSVRHLNDVRKTIEEVFRHYSNHFALPHTRADIVAAAKSGGWPFSPFLMLSASPVGPVYFYHEDGAYFVNFNEEAAAELVHHIVMGPPTPSQSGALVAELKAAEDDAVAKLAARTKLTSRIEENAHFRHVANCCTHQLEVLDDELAKVKVDIEHLKKQAIGEDLSNETTLRELAGRLNRKRNLESRICSVKETADSNEAKALETEPETAKLLEERAALSAALAVVQRTIAELRAALEASVEEDKKYAVNLRRMLNILGVDEEAQPTNEELKRMMMWALKLLHVVDGRGNVMVPEILLSVHTSLSPATSTGKARPTVSHGTIQCGAAPNASIMTAAAHLVAFLCDVESNGDNMPELLRVTADMQEKLAITTLKSALYNWFPHGAESILIDRRPDYVSRPDLFVDAVHAVVGTFYGIEETVEVARLAGLRWLVHEARGSRDGHFWFFDFDRVPDTVIHPIVEEDRDVYFEYKVIALCASMETKAEFDAYMSAYYARIARAEAVRRFINDAKKARLLELNEAIAHLQIRQREVPKFSREWRALETNISFAHRQLHCNRDGRRVFEDDLLTKLKDELDAMRILEL